MDNALKLLRAFYADRPVMAEHNTLDFLLSRLLMEVEELQDDPPEYMSREQYVTQELADIVIFALAALDLLCKDPEAAIVEKISRNHCKMPAAQFKKNGDRRPYDERIVFCSTEWKNRRGNEEFYKILQIIAASEN